MRSILALALASIALVVGCAAAQEEAPQKSAAAGLQFERFSETSVKGTWSLDGQHVVFDSERVGNNTTVTLDVNGIKVDVSINRDAQVLDYDGHRSALAPADRKALEGFKADLEKISDEKAKTVLGENQELAALDSLHRQVTYLAKAPLNFTLVKRTVQVHIDPAVSAEKNRNSMSEGITYLWQCKKSADWNYKIATAQWTQGNGQWWQWTAACGNRDPACAGRCGGGCTCDSWYCANRYYTKDCFDHDKCLDFNVGEATSSPFAPNCGDEWTDAADDYTFGSSSGW